MTRKLIQRRHLDRLEAPKNHPKFLPKKKAKNHGEGHAKSRQKSHSKKHSKKSYYSKKEYTELVEFFRLVIFNDDLFNFKVFRGISEKNRLIIKMLMERLLKKKRLRCRVTYANLKQLLSKIHNRTKDQKRKFIYRKFFKHFYYKEFKNYHSNLVKNVKFVDKPEIYECSNKHFYYDLFFYQINENKLPVDLLMDIVCDNFKGMQKRPGTNWKTSKCKKIESINPMIRYLVASDKNCNAKFLDFLDDPDHGILLQTKLENKRKLSKLFAQWDQIFRLCNYNFKNFKFKLSNHMKNPNLNIGWRKIDVIDAVDFCKYEQKHKKNYLEKYFFNVLRTYNLDK